MGLTDANEPKLGLYRHYAGPLYRLLVVADWHEHDGRRVAVYKSLERGTTNARPYDRRGGFAGEDCWTDVVDKPEHRFQGQRFTLIAENPIEGTPHSLTDALRLLEEARQEAADAKKRVTELEARLAEIEAEERDARYERMERDE